MYFGYYIISDELKKELEDITNLGKSQDGTIKQSQLSAYIKRERSQNYKRNIIFDTLEKNNITILYDIHNTIEPIKKLRKKR